MALARHLPVFAHSLFRKFEDKRVPFLLAGGWAVSFHGHSRATLDIDWICRQSQYDEAAQLMESMGFVLVFDGMASRFKHRGDPSIPFIDLIWVDDATFAMMEEEAEGSPPPLVVSMLGFR